MKTSEYREGKTRLVVPSASLKEDPPPTTPVFFNPAASLNRDVSVAVTAATGGTSFCDSMAGAGARGIRIANEVRRVERVALVDFNADALRLARSSASLNGIGRKCEFSNSEASAYLYSRYGREQRFGYVDVDPFGTPIRQLQAALCATADGGVLSLTATDTAVLCGVYPQVSRRRYGAVSLNNGFNHETGIRILLGAVAREGASLDIGVEPIVAHATRHYLRAFVRISAGASKANGSLAGLGFIAWCPACGATRALAERIPACESCGRKLKSAGPLWLGSLTDGEVLRGSGAQATRMGLPSAAAVLGSLEGVDSFPPWSFDLDDICSTLRVSTVAEEAVFSGLRELGYRAMRTPFQKTGIKTDAGYSEVVDVVRRGARARSGVVSEVRRPSRGRKGTSETDL